MRGMERASCARSAREKSPKAGKNSRRRRKKYPRKRGKEGAKMCVHAISIAQAEDLTFRILNEILSGSAQHCGSRRHRDHRDRPGTQKEVTYP